MGWDCGGWAVLVISIYHANIMYTVFDPSSPFASRVACCVMNFVDLTQPTCHGIAVRDHQPPMITGDGIEVRQ